MTAVSSNGCETHAGRCVRCLMLFWHLASVQTFPSRRNGGYEFHVDAFQAAVLSSFRKGQQVTSAVVDTGLCPLVNPRLLSR